jgi:hypothetical protein
MLFSLFQWFEAELKSQIAEIALTEAENRGRAFVQ